MDPKINSQLNRVLEEGKSKDVPSATMFEALRKLVIKLQKHNGVQYIHISKFVLSHLYM